MFTQKSQWSMSRLQPQSYMVSFLPESMYLMNLLKRKTVLRITRAVRDSSCWDLDNVRPSSIWPSWCIIACNEKSAIIHCIAITITFYLYKDIFSFISNSEEQMWRATYNFNDLHNHDSSVNFGPVHKCDLHEKISHQRTSIYLYCL